MASKALEVTGFSVCSLSRGGGGLLVQIDPGTATWLRLGVRRGGRMLAEHLLRHVLTRNSESGSQPVGVGMQLEAACCMRARQSQRPCAHQLPCPGVVRHEQDAAV